METVGIIVGMIGAFIAGAWVRKPFERTCRKKTGESNTAPVEEREQRDRKAKQISNLLSYTGAAQEDIEE